MTTNQLARFLLLSGTNLGVGLLWLQPSIQVTSIYVAKFLAFPAMKLVNLLWIYFTIKILVTSCCQRGSNSIFSWSPTFLEKFSCVFIHADGSTQGQIHRHPFMHKIFFLIQPLLSAVEDTLWSSSSLWTDASRQLSNPSEMQSFFFPTGKCSSQCYCLFLVRNTQMYSKFLFWAHSQSSQAERSI